LGWHFYGAFGHSPNVTETMKRIRNSSEWTPAKLLAEAKRTGQRIEDMPVELVRDAMRRGFLDMRRIELPTPVIRESLATPLLRDLLVTRIGYSSRSAGHFIPRPAGSLDHIFILCAAGKGWLRIGSRTWEATENTALFLPAGVPHWYGADTKSPWSLYWIHFTGRQAAEYFAELGVDSDHPLLHLETNEELLSAFRHIEEFMADVHTRDNLVAASGALARYLGLLNVRRYGVQPVQRSEEQNVQQTITFMRENLARPMALRELAQLAHMSVSHYEAVFTKRTGISPMHYLTQMRVQKACRLLTETDQPVKLIAKAVGMEDPYYFSRWFKKLLGGSPLEFRDRGFTKRPQGR
jgi:AraC family transcriptional regulator, arabinose operon regulatory protein